VRTVTTALRYLLFVTGVAIHLWTVWIAWTAKGAFAGLFTLTVPFLGEIVWAGWLSWQAGTPWHPYVQVLLSYLAVALLHRVLQRRMRASPAGTGSSSPDGNPDSD
jgi:hypothetical protein